MTEPQLHRGETTGDYTRGYIGTEGRTREKAEEVARQAVRGQRVDWRSDRKRHGSDLLIWQPVIHSGSIPTRGNVFNSTPRSGCVQPE